jgi:hypothetical protein
MAVLKLETVVQTVLVRDVVVVAGTNRIGARLADRATPTALPFAWLPAHDADPGPNPLSNRGKPAMQKQSGLRAGRSVRSSWGHRRRHPGLRTSRSLRWSLTPRVAATYRSAGRCPALGRRGTQPGSVN